MYTLQTQAGQQAYIENRNTNPPQHIFKLFEDKELAVKALLGEYGNIRFLEKIKSEFNISETYSDKLEDTSLAPYLMEFQISTSLTLFHLWLKREKDLEPEKLFSLIHELYSNGAKEYFQLNKHTTSLFLLIEEESKDKEKNQTEEKKQKMLAR